MHIPDGYLGPQTYGTLYALTAPFWYYASKVLKKTLKARHATHLALGSAFSFVIMMFNIPMPGGATGHAVGASLVAILLGPWAAVMAVSIALIIQALLFGDGGITAIGANCFNMAVVMPFAGYYTYKLLASGSDATSPRRIFAAGVAGYISLNLAAFLTAVEFGIQPLIAHAPDGTPLYAPYSLDVAVPVMAFEHLVLFGFIEALVTGLVVMYIGRSEPALLGLRTQASAETRRAAPRALWFGVGVLILLTPLGLIASGTAWGEWGIEELQSLLGFVPKGLKSLEGMWRSILPDYGFPGGQGPFMSALAYMGSAALGVLAILLVAFIASRFLPSEGKAS